MALEREHLVSMRDSMKHGGPDDAGIYLDEELRIGLGHRRLSLIDLTSSGHQPMFNQSGQVVLIFNGEIYNFRELRAELETAGHQFVSQSDSEVIIEAYLEWGRDCFKRFNGMFAVCLLDKRINKLILARDHSGIKPLYYSIRNHQLIFASEVRAFKALDKDWPENQDWRKYFLLFGHLPEPVTTLKGVEPLSKGTIMEVDLPSLRISKHKFFTLYFSYPISSMKEAVAKVHDVLIESVKRHLISDAPIGLFLSGGLDSSLLTMIARRFIPENLHTLSIVFENEKYSEKYYQDVVIQATGAKHKSYLVTQKDFLDCMPDILKAMDQPSSDGINSYFISKYAHAYGLKAALSGLGADELFGGYSSFNRTNLINSVSRVPSFVFQAASLFPDDRRKKIKFLGVKGGLGEYLFNRGFYSPSSIAMLLDCTVNEVDTLMLQMQEDIPEFTHKLLPEERVSYLERNLYMQNQLLKDTDYMSMWHGLEVRVPFLDKELMELCYSIHPSIRYSKVLPKSLLIEAFGREMPEEIWKRPKQGFAFPFEYWMQEVFPRGPVRRAQFLQEGLKNGNVHWSRYWAYVLTQELA